VPSSSTDSAGGLDVCVVGSVGRDLLFQVDALPRPGQTVRSADLATAIGGKGANQAAAAATLGRRTALLARIGADDGADLLADLTRSGVLTSACLPTEGTPSHHAVLLVAPDGENMISVSQGASAHLSPEDVDEHAALIRSARVVLLQQEIPAETVAAAILAAGGGGDTGVNRPLTILNPAPFRSVAPELLARVDILVPNAGELADLLDADEPETADQAVELLRSADMAARCPSRCVIVTLGAEGALIASPDLPSDGTGTGRGSGAAQRGEEVRFGPGFAHVAAPKVEVVDTVGAGDVFCGALADALARGVDLVGAVRWATHAAALAVTRPGAQGGLPTAAAVTALLERGVSQQP
jgi:ribokinase